MSEYKCRAIEDGKRQCNNDCWGRTIYCMWHNCILTWRALYLWASPQKRSAGWAAYDPDLLSDWRPPTMLTTSIVLFWIISIPINTAFAKFLGSPGYAKFSFLQVLTGALWYSVTLAIVAMVFGNNNSLLPKIVLVEACLLVIMSLYEWTQVPSASESSKIILNLIGSLGLLLYTVPPPTGPLANADADVTDMSVLPPTNIGSGILRGVGAILIVIFLLGSLIQWGG